jgi:hypothetical protein
MNYLEISYNTNKTDCPKSENKPDLRWIAAPIIIIILLIIVIVLYFIHKQHSTPKDTPETLPDPPFPILAVANYDAVDDSQLSIVKGVRYEVVRIDEGHYWFQSRSSNGKLGWFPASYAKILDKKEKDFYLKF